MILVCATLTPRSLYLILGYVENDNYTDVYRLSSLQHRSTTYLMDVQIDESLVVSRWDQADACMVPYCLQLIDWELACTARELDLCEANVVNLDTSTTTFKLTLVSRLQTRPSADPVHREITKACSKVLSIGQKTTMPIS